LIGTFAGQPAITLKVGEFGHVGMNKRVEPYLKAWNGAVLTEEKIPGGSSPRAPVQVGPSKTDEF
jgi:hypothetical protein